MKDLCHPEVGIPDGISGRSRGIWGHFLKDFGAFSPDFGAPSVIPAAEDEQPQTLFLGFPPKEAPKAGKFHN